MTPYCPHFHIDRGESQCWAVVDNIGKHGMSIEQIQQYTRPTLCNGDEGICEFKKFAVKKTKLTKETKRYDYEIFKRITGADDKEVM